MKKRGKKSPNLWLAEDQQRGTENWLIIKLRSERGIRMKNRKIVDT
jgi:hypothetical protein